MSNFPLSGRLPPYVFQVLNQDKKALMESGKEIFEFGMGNPDQPTPPHIVERMIQASKEVNCHSYASSEGNLNIREAICAWYDRKYQVNLNPVTDTVVTIGAKEGISHLTLATTCSQDSVIIPTPCYPIHQYGFVISGAKIHFLLLEEPFVFLQQVEKLLMESWPRPKMLLLNFPSNPTTHCVDLAFFEQVIALAKQYKIWVIHDFAYADLTFDSYKAPSILQVPGAIDVAVEVFSMSKSYNMAGWRVGFITGNPELVAALKRLKSYRGYGLYTPLQEGAIAALLGPQDCVEKICKLYQKRRDLLCKGLNQLGWEVQKPKATMFLWAKIPEPFRSLKSINFAKLLLNEAQVVVSPGLGFGVAGDEYVRFALIQDAEVIDKACESIQRLFIKGDTAKISHAAGR